MNKIFILFSLFAFIISSPTNCKVGVQGNTIEFLPILFQLDEVKKDECEDAYICKLNCNCSSGDTSISYFKMLTNDQINLYLKICTTTFADGFLKRLESNEEKFKIELIRKFFLDNGLGNTLSAQGISPPISILLKTAVVNYLTTNEDKILKVGQFCCKPGYETNTKFRTAFFIMALKFFNSFANLKALCQKSRRQPKELIDQVFTQSIAGKPYDLTKYTNVVPQIQELKNLMLKIYNNNKDVSCDCNSMMKYSQNKLQLDTSSFQLMLNCNC